MIKTIIKRAKHEEAYDSKKVYASIYASALNAHMSEGECEEIAEEVLGNVDRMVRTQDFLTSENIRDEVIRSLEMINKDVATLYKHHHHIC